MDHAPSAGSCLTVLTDSLVGHLLSQSIAPTGALSFIGPSPYNLSVRILSLRYRGAGVARERGGVLSFSHRLLMDVL